MEAMFVNNDALFINNFGRLAILERRPEAKRRRAQEIFPVFFSGRFLRKADPIFQINLL
jgi:hypothetical protein